MGGEGRRARGEPILMTMTQTRPPLGFECCTRAGGWDACSSALDVGRGAAAFASLMVGAMVLIAG